MEQKCSFTASLINLTSSLAPSAVSQPLAWPWPRSWLAPSLPSGHPAVPLTASPWMSEERTCTPVGRECGGLKLECTSIRTCTIAFLTRVYSWNTYFAHLFVMNTWPDCFRICLYFRVRVVELLTVNTTRDFERGGAKASPPSSSSLPMASSGLRGSNVLMVIPSPTLFSFGWSLISGAITTGAD